VDKNKKAEIEKRKQKNRRESVCNISEVSQWCTVVGQQQGGF